MIRWRRRHVSAARVDAVRAALANYPGADDVIVDLTGLGARVRLPVRVDAQARGLLRAVHEATGCTGMAHVIDREDAW